MLAADRIVADLPTALQLAYAGSPPPSAITLITGPSASSDIEKIRVTGRARASAHGRRGGRLMSESVRTVTGSIESDATPETVGELLRDGSRIPEWAPAFADAVTCDGELWRATMGQNDFTFSVVAVREAGTVDYIRELAPGELGGAYLRVVPRPRGGSVITMTLPVRPGGAPDEVRATLTAELIALEALASVE